MTGNALRRAATMMPILFSLLAATPALADGDLTAATRFVEARCGDCHVTAPGQPKKHAAAPDFSEISTRYSPAALGEAFAEGIVVGHPDMPEFELTSEQIAQLTLFLRSLRD